MRLPGFDPRDPSGRRDQTKWPSSAIGGAPALGSISISFLQLNNLQLIFRCFSFIVLLSRWRNDVAIETRAHQCKVNFCKNCSEPNMFLLPTDEQDSTSIADRSQEFHQSDECVNPNSVKYRHYQVCSLVRFQTWKDFSNYDRDFGMGLKQ